MMAEAPPLTHNNNDAEINNLATMDLQDPLLNVIERVHTRINRTCSIGIYYCNLFVNVLSLLFIFIMLLKLSDKSPCCERNTDDHVTWDDLAKLMVNCSFSNGTEIIVVPDIIEVAAPPIPSLLPPPPYAPHPRHGGGDHWY